MKKKNLLIAVFAVFSGIAEQSFAGQGFHGAKTVTTTNTILNEFTTLTANAAQGATSITVASSSLNANARFPANLAAGELVMIIQMQGVTMNTSNANASTWGAVTAYNNSGKYEFNEVLSVPNSTTINFAYGLNNSYTASGKVQVVRVPRYTTFTVNAAKSVSTQAWNGSTGGIIAIEANGAIVINGTIDASGLGFRGGLLKQTSTCCPQGTGNALLFATTNNSLGAAKGEGIGGDTTAYDGLGGRYGRGPAANGGGGGNIHNTGGGGGSNGDNGVAWNGLGIPDTITVSNWKQAWDLEGGNFHTNVSSGGGRGGYSYANSNASPLTVAPGSNSWTNDYRSNIGGWGGRPLNSTSGSRIFMGGGGGSGDSNDGFGSSGANGGGIVYLIAGSTISGTGAINANGADAANSLKWDAAGGGGGGGSAIIYTGGASVTGVGVNAKGGKGGNQQYSSGLFQESEGPGGGGGGGYISITTPNSLSQSVIGGLYGTTNANKMGPFTPNGATAAATGITATNPPNPYSTSPLPVKLTSFRAFLKENYVELDWTTLSETNNNYFIVEKSGDTKLVSELIKINGAGNSTVKLDYHAEDNHPLAGTCYYRLKQVDYNGQVTSSKWIDVNVKPAHEMLVFPNPVKTNTIKIVLPQTPSSSCSFYVCDRTGKAIFNRKIRGDAFDNNMTVSDIPFAATGLYYLTVEIDGTIYREKISVQLEQ